MMHNYTNRYYNHCCSEDLRGADWPRENKNYKIDDADNDCMCGSHGVPMAWWSEQAKIEYAENKKRNKEIKIEEDERMSEMLADFEARKSWGDSFDN